MTAKSGLIVALALGALIVALVAPPIAQDPAYHEFVDRQEILGVANFWNVVSNIPFAFVGIAGLFVVGRKLPPGAIPALRPAYVMFFIGVALVSLGSGYYHLGPANASLVWDRLPMTFAFMAFFAAIVGENISVDIGARLLWPLVAVGVFSVGYWHFTELGGRGDLRPYALVQFLPMLLIPVILLLYRSPFTGNLWIWLALLAYAASKIAELADAPVFAAVGIGGHAFKHLLAALGALFVLLALVLRRPIERSD